MIRARRGDKCGRRRLLIERGLVRVLDYRFRRLLLNNSNCGSRKKS